MDEPKKVDHVVTQEDLDAGKFEGSNVGDTVQVEEETSVSDESANTTEDSTNESGDDSAE